MAAPDTYLTLKERIRIEIPKIKGSRFIADAFPIQNLAEIESAIHEIRQAEANATHHCYAYRLQDPQHFRANDDGEPSGTAGMPILRQIDRFQLLDCLVVVTRYYGGTKLGTGGLIRAYGEAAATILQTAEIIENIRFEEMVFVFDYSDTAQAMHSLRGFETQMGEMHYSEQTALTVKVRASQQKALEARFLELLQGRGKIRSP